MTKKSTPGMWGELGATIRYALTRTDRTARLACLMLIAIISWHYYLL